MKNEKLTVLDFKKETLVNLNEENISAIKGGASTLQCTGTGITYGTLVYRNAKKASLIHCENPKGSKKYVITQDQFSEVSCASVPPVVIQANR